MYKSSGFHETRRFFWRAMNESRWIRAFFLVEKKANRKKGRPLVVHVWHVRRMRCGWKSLYSFFFFYFKDISRKTRGYERPSSWISRNSQKHRQNLYTMRCFVHIFFFVFLREEKEASTISCVFVIFETL